MALSSFLAHVFYSQALRVGARPSVAVGVGITGYGKLAAFTWDDLASAGFLLPVAATQSPDVPHHVAVTTDGGTLRLYVDGALTVSGTVTHTTAAPTATAIGGVYIGAGNSANQLNCHRVCLGEFAFWQRTLTGTEVTGLTNPFSQLPAGEVEAQRMTEILDWIGWPASWRAGLLHPGTGVWHTTGELLTPPKWSVGATALELLQRAAAAVDGVVFISADGRFAYQTRDDRDPGAVEATFRESDGTSIDTSFAYQIDDNDIVNKVIVTAANGLTFTWGDPTSIATYGERELSADWDLGNAGDLLAAAHRAVNRRKNPIMRCPTVTVDLSASPDDTRWCLGADLGATIALADLPASAPASSMSFIIESAAWDIDADSGHWTVTWEISPGILGIILNDASRAVLDTMTLGG
jgi:hypothetical protein